MMTRALCLLVFVVLVLSSCSSRRLEYQELGESSNQSAIQQAIPKNSRLGNKFTLPNVQTQKHSYTPQDTDHLVPRPVAVVIRQRLDNKDSVFLGEHSRVVEDVISVDIDSRYRPTLRSDLPAEILNKELLKYLDNTSMEYQEVDPQIFGSTECMIIYQLNYVDSPLFLCLQKTLESSYLATQAEDADDDSLDEKGRALLKKIVAQLY